MQWALSSEEIDMAIICKEATREFIKYDNNFEIVCPLIQNSDVFLFKEEYPKNIGITQNRNYQSELIKRYYKDSEIVPLIGRSLAYALESKLVEGVVIDSMRAIALEGKKIPTTTLGDYNTYVLIVNKKFKGNDTYDEFISLYNQSVEELKSNNNFKKALNEYKDIDISNKDLGEIKSWKLKFLQIKETK